MKHLDLCDFVIRVNFEKKKTKYRKFVKESNILVQTLIPALLYIHSTVPVMIPKPLYASKPNLFLNATSITAFNYTVLLIRLLFLTVFHSSNLSSDPAAFEPGTAASALTSDTYH